MTTEPIHNCSSCTKDVQTLFKCLKKSSLKFILDSKQNHFIVKGTLLYKKGDSAGGFYCVQSGLIRTYIESDQGKAQTFKIHSVGQWVGCRDSILGDIYNHTAICLEDAKLCYIKRDSIEELMQIDADFQRDLLKQMAMNWRDSENQAYSLGIKPLHAKLAELLVTYYEASKHSNQIELKITREIMASIIGTTTESVIRSLSDFKVRNWIKLSKNKIIVQNIKALKEISEFDKEKINY